MILAEKLATILHLAIILSCSGQESTMKAALVCLGGQLTLTCDTLMSGETLIKWSVTLSDEEHRETRFISSLGSADSVTPLTAGHTAFQFLRASISPLISTMVIDNATEYIHGTRIDCSYGGSLISTSIITVIGPHTVIPNPFVIISEQFGPDNITVFVEWAGEEGVIHNVMSVPCTSIISQYGRSIQLTLPYNTVHNVSIVFTLCGQMSISDLQLYYVKCGSLLHLFADESITVAGFSDPSLVGSTITIECRFGSISSSKNHNNITCLENGEWDSDPNQITDKCKGNCGAPVVKNSTSYIIEYGSTLEGSTLQFSCKDGYLPNDVITATCYHNESWIPDPASHICTATTSSRNTSASLMLDLSTTLATVVSSVAALLLSSIFFYFVGFICGRRYQKQAKSGGIKNAQTQQQSEEQPIPVPVYEELQSTSDQVKAFELNENVAYGPTL